MTMRRIKMLTVLYDDETAEQWTGQGMVSKNETEILSSSRVAGQGTPVHYVMAVLGLQVPPKKEKSNGD